MLAQSHRGIEQCDYNLPKIRAFVASPAPTLCVLKLLFLPRSCLNPVPFSTVDSLNMYAHMVVLELEHIQISKYIEISGLDDVCNFVFEDIWFPEI